MLLIEKNNMITNSIKRFLFPGRLHLNTWKLTRARQLNSSNLPITQNCIWTPFLYPQFIKNKVMFKITFEN